MGLFDTLKKVGSSTYDALQKTSVEIEDLKDRMDHCSDDQLFQNLRYGSYQQKSACSQLLLERGYSREEVATAIKGRK